MFHPSRRLVLMCLQKFDSLLDELHVFLEIKVFVTKHKQHTRSVIAKVVLALNAAPDNH